MKTSLSALTMILIAQATPAMLSQESRDTCTVVYIANEGFLIETKNHKVLIDALFGSIKGDWCEQPGDSLSSKIIHGVAPFDGIDALLITHKHVDHFSEPMVIDFLKNNRQSVLICPEQVNELLESNADYAKVSGRVKSLQPGKDFDTSLSVRKMKVRVMRFDHGAYILTDSATGKPYNIHGGVENFCYLVESDGFTVFHSGDCSTSDTVHFAEYGFAEKSIDIVLVSRSFLGREGMDLLSRAVRTNTMIFMHVEPGRAEYYRTAIKGVPEMSIFAQSLEKKIILK
jgi:L-ascorbate metabolism protein UlaG (beta-lactamase superfamily)